MQYSPTNQLNSRIYCLITQLRGSRCLFLWQRQQGLPSHPVPSPSHPLTKPSDWQNGHCQKPWYSSCISLQDLSLAGWEDMVYRATFSAFKNSVETKSQSCNSSQVNPNKLKKTETYCGTYSNSVANTSKETMIFVHHLTKCFVHNAGHLAWKWKWTHDSSHWVKSLTSSPKPLFVSRQGVSWTHQARVSVCKSEIHPRTF